MEPLYGALSMHQTRLIRISPGELGKVSLTLVTCQLPSKQEDGSSAKPTVDGKEIWYCALSHTWGDSTTFDKLHIRDKYGVKHAITVTSHLPRTIRYVCHQAAKDGEAELYIWIDQICINQQSNEEKFSQIRLMRRIYETASTVVAWLGFKGDDSPLAFKKVREILAIYPLMRGGDGEEPPHDVYPKKVNDLIDRALQNTPENERAWRAVGKFFARAWFGRIWIRQEATAINPDATLIMCGSSTIRLGEVFNFLWVIIGMAARIWPTNFNVGQKSFSELAQIRYFYSDRNSGEPLPLLKLVRDARGAQATDLRDKVFCLLSFASDLHGTIETELQLTGNDPVDAVYAKFMIWILTRHKNLDLLAECNGLQLPEVPLPTWVPNWSVSQAYAAFGRKGETPDCAASGRYAGKFDVGPFIHIDSPPRILLLKAARVATVAEVSSMFDTTAEGLTALETWYATRESNSSCVLNRMPFREVFARTINAYTGTDGSPAVLDLDGIFSQDRLNVRVAAIVHNRCMFITAPGSDGAPGLLGIGPGIIRPGDGIFMLKGARYLYALNEEACENALMRPCLDLTGGSDTVVRVRGDQSICSLVGVSFMVGLMKGEILDFMGDSDTPRKPPSALENMEKEFRTIVLL